jgi:hypothetical protein
MFRYILVILLLLLPQPAGADCYMPAPPDAQEGTVAATWPAKHVEDGDIGGCLLKFSLAAGGEWLGYTRYDFICKLSASEKITLMPDFACCDTGDHGDYACGVKPRGLFDTLKRTNITLTPALPDARAIPEMVHALKGGQLQNAVAAIRLKEYLGDTQLAEEVKKNIAPLEDSLEAVIITDPYVRAQVAALLAAAWPESKKRAFWDVTFFQGDIGFALTDAQKAVMARMTADPATADYFIPELAKKLRQTDEEGKAAILAAAAAYGPAAKRHATVLRDALTSELPTDWDKPAEPLPAPPTDEVEAKRYAAMLDMMKKEETERTARAKILLPLLAKIACHGETGSVKIGKNYPTNIDCAKKPD